MLPVCPKPFPQLLKRFRICFLFGVFTFLVSMRAFAGTEPYTNALRGKIKKGDSLIVKDEKFRSSFFQWNKIEKQKVSNIISLQLFQDTTAVLPRSFSCAVKLKIEYYSDPNQAEPLRINNVTLRIKYKGDTSKLNKVLDTYAFNNGHWVKVVIEDIQSDEYVETSLPFCSSLPKS